MTMTRLTECLTAAAWQVQDLIGISPKYNSTSQKYRDIYTLVWEISINHSSAWSSIKEPTHNKEASQEACKFGTLLTENSCNITLPLCPLYYG